MAKEKFQINLRCETEDERQELTALLMSLKYSERKTRTKALIDLIKAKLNK